ncbi:hypothetical protein D3C76_1347280 [compost metagenome]
MAGTGNQGEGCGEGIGHGLAVFGAGDAVGAAAVHFAGHCLRRVAQQVVAAQQLDGLAVAVRL